MQNMFYILIYTDYKLSYFTLYIKITVTNNGYSENTVYLTQLMPNPCRMCILLQFRSSKDYTKGMKAADFL